jgi:hypothetical protein
MVFLAVPMEMGENLTPAAGETSFIVNARGWGSGAVDIAVANSFPVSDEAANAKDAIKERTAEKVYKTRFIRLVAKVGWLGCS